MEVSVDHLIITSSATQEINTNDDSPAIAQVTVSSNSNTEGTQWIKWITVTFGLVKKPILCR